MMALSLLSCGSSDNSHSAIEGDTIAMRHAVNLTMVDYGDYTTAVCRSPWDTTRVLQTFVLVPKGAELPRALPQVTVIRVPIERSVVYTSVHNSLIDELGALDAVKGVCDAKYIMRPALRQALQSGVIADCGTSMTPNLERILMLNPEAILLSAFENSSDHNKVAQMGIPVIDCIDYMETSPLGRAEWMRFFGRLYGRQAEADSLFDAVEQAYYATKAQVGDVEHRPKVLTDMIYGQTWSVPGAHSTMGILIEDAGGKNPFDSYSRSGGVQLAPEQVLYQANDADVWLVRYAGKLPLTLAQLAADNDIYSKFAPYATGEVYGCNTEESSYHEETQFHPDWLLAEIARILHPELQLQSAHQYFTKVK